MQGLKKRLLKTFNCTLSHIPENALCEMQYASESVTSVPEHFN